MENGETVSLHVLMYYGNGEACFARKGSSRKYKEEITNKKESLISFIYTPINDNINKK